MERKPINWHSKFSSLHPRRATAAWKSSSLGARAIFSVLALTFVLALLYQHVVGRYELLPMIAPVLLYVGLGAGLWLLALLVLLCGMALDRVGVLVWLQLARDFVLKGVGVIFALLLIVGLLSLIKGAFASMSTPMAIFIGAVIIALLMNGSRT